MRGLFGESIICWRLRMLAASIAALLLAACSPVAKERRLGDLLFFPQHLSAYVQADTAHRPLLPTDRQERMQLGFRRRFLAPWQPGWSKWQGKDFFAIGKWLLDAPVYGSNREPLPMSLRRQWLFLCDEQAFPSADYPAITVHAANLRGVPARQPVFYNPALPGEGFPFDYLQYSSLPAGTPVRVRHRSADGCWLLVETEAMFGWIPAPDVAPVDEACIDMYAAAPWRVVIADGVPLRDEYGEVLAVASLGSVWPQAQPGQVLVPVRGEGGRAELRSAGLREVDGPVFPLSLTPASIADLGERLLGNPYDWGGQFGSRDCSATLRDLFACFGLYLPRNSAAQARQGVRLELASLTATEKASVIRLRAVPWLTLVHMPGHIMLYVGEFNGQPAFLHTLWGLRIRERGGVEGRYPVGRTVITGWRPGDELDSLLRPEGVLLNRIQTLVLLDQEAGE
ncbi:hypothetical protein A7E75_08955 [Syntrophotalea acetylenica]|uniref:NlpC/P60 domain-containing protein n=2 Tax=Syntrophotalea acetylenica TaxID=29542 RepID=A0A1L3GGQ7_SYNAC|nr:hypothetical protein A7E75_08955 [Syntrophotalea acetylenica]APG43203.1 hypothetical protein A6070_02930 [Syntrophotalea acetylenica]